MSDVVARLTVSHPRGTTAVTIGPGAFAVAAQELSEWTRRRRVFVITTAQVHELHGEAIGALVETAASHEVIEVEEGEAAKSLASAESLWCRLVESGGKRDSRLVTFGGGSVGDLGGFVAGCFLRGIGYAQLPTTLLAQVDASLGGKTAVDLPEAKNSVGLFHHPDLVISETGWLATLPRRELVAGLMEAVKMGFTLDPVLFERLEQTLESATAGAPAVLGEITVRAAAAKIAVVEADPEEGDHRKVLNFGHTLGHALETATSYEGLRHGEAVGWGMRFALRLARRRRLDEGAAVRLERLLDRADLPELPRLELDRLVELTARDKKAREGGLTWVLPTAVGAVEMVDDVGGVELRAALEQFLLDHR